LPDQQTITIIGGGAAGLMASYFAKLNHPADRVILIEKNSYLGAKVIISGGGRCNVTTGIKDVKRVLENYPRGAQFLRTAIYAFPPQSVMDWFESQGVPLKTEEDLRVFPVSNNGKDIVGTLEKALQESGVEIMLNTQITEIQNTADQKFQLHFKNGTSLISDQLILTTGGNAYRHTGSTGDGYAFAKALGHSITTLAPSLSSLNLAENWTHQLSGISFTKAKISFQQNEIKAERTGPFLFTHKGISGPAVFALSALVAHQTLTPEQPAQLQLDLLPELNEEKLDKDLQEKFQQNPTKKLVNVLGFIVPHRLAEHLLSNLPQLIAIQPKLAQALNGLTTEKLLDLTCTNVSKDLRKAIILLLKKLPLTVNGRGAGDEFVTAGGIPLSEVDSKTMQSKITPGLFFAGELLDIDGFTGGFNLQASWATGALAGENA
jgi:hypothetical protein